MLFEGRNLSKRYGKFTALKDASFSLEAGQTLGVIGESGAGKTTLVKIALGILDASEGSVLFEGKPLPRGRRGRQQFTRAVQAVFQDPAGSLDPRVRILSTMREPFRIHGVRGGSRIEASIREALAAVGLSELVLQRFPRELSGGECQRVAIARAVVLEPRVLICDEPVSSLDPLLRAGVLNIFLRLQKEKGLALLFVSHDLGVIRHLSDQVMVLKDGIVCEHGSREAVFDRPQQAYTRSLLSASLLANPKPPVL